MSFADVDLPWNASIDVDLEPTAVAGSRVERFQKHRLASLGLEVFRAEILHALVHLVETPHLRLLVQQANDARGMVRRPKSTSTNSFSDCAKSTFLFSLSTNSFTPMVGASFLAMVVILLDEVVWFLLGLHETCNANVIP